MTIPKTTASALSVTMSALLAPLAIPQDTVEKALDALIAELSGTGTRTITNSTPLDRVLTVKQTAELLGRSTKTVRNMARRGLIRAVHMGKARERAGGYAESSVRAFLAGGNTNESKGASDAM